MNNNEIKFMIFFEDNLLNKKSSSYDIIKQGMELIGRTDVINCPSCAKNAYYELLNKYGQLTNAWNQYKNSLEEVKVKDDKVVEEDIKIAQVAPDEPEKKAKKKPCCD